jgi:hypothetical protein
MCHGGESHRLGYSGDGALAVEAVIGEPVSARIPCFGGKYREISAFDADNGEWTPHSRADPRRPPRVPYDSKQGISLT